MPIAVCEATLAITPDNSDVLQQIDFGPETQAGENKVEMQVDGKISALFQVVGRYYLPNTSHFGGVDTGVTDSNFMRITSSYGERQIRFGLRLAF